MQQVVQKVMISNQLQAPTKIPKKIEMVAEKEPTMSASMDMGAGVPGGTGVPGGVPGGFGAAPTPVVKAAPEKPKKVNISSGVATGLLLQRVQPIYPPIAKAARVSGTVVLQATISKSGSIENLRVVSGNAMLQQAALEAVRNWKYKPYLLNGDPVEVDTTINVVFNLGG